MLSALYDAVIVCALALAPSADVAHVADPLLIATLAHNVVDVELLKRLLTSKDFRARAAATRVLCYWRDRVPDALGLLRTQAADESPRVRLEAVRAASFFIRTGNGGTLLSTPSIHSASRSCRRLLRGCSQEPGRVRPPSLV